MQKSQEQRFFGHADATEILDVVSEEFADTIGLVMPFSLEEPLVLDSVHPGLPGAEDEVRVAFRLGFRTPAGARAGFIQVPLESALILSGGLQTLPADEIRAMSARKAPNDEDKAAIHECGKILGCAIDSRFKMQLGPESEVIFAGCQGIGPGEAPTLPGYGGEAFTVRWQQAGFPGFDLFELLIAIPL
ncbi:hypothetical protein N9Z54_00340 [Planctomycetota bacterium]|nr:hypothetical protein [Planctomycetota bacterium]